MKMINNKKEMIGSVKEQILQYQFGEKRPTVYRDEMDMIKGITEKVFGNYVKEFKYQVVVSLFCLAHETLKACNDSCRSHDELLVNILGDCLEFYLPERIEK
jgi:predicted  nucleic acid-binding Zn ribbon protein